MSDLKTRVYDDVKTAMKAGEKERLAMLRMLTAELKQREVVESTELTDAVVQSAVEKMIKQRRDSETQFRNGNRPELAEQAARENEMLMAYLDRTHVVEGKSVPVRVDRGGRRGIKKTKKKPHQNGQAK